MVVTVSIFCPFQFARYQDGIVNITVSTLPAPSICSSGHCTNCLEAAQGVTLAYKAGDVIIAALVNAHEPSGQRLGCGASIPDRLIDAVAVKFAADTVADNTNLRLSVGYLIVDVCPGKYHN